MRKEKHAPPFFRATSGVARFGKQFGCGHTPKFLLGRRPAKMLVGEHPQTRLFGQNVPKRLAASPPLSRLFLVIAPVRKAEQMVDVGLDSHGLPHIPLGLPILGIEGLFPVRQLPPLFFQCVHFGELLTA